MTAALLSSFLQFEIGAADDLRDELCQIHLVHSGRSGGGVESRDREQTLDHVVKTLDVLLHVIEGGVVSLPLASEVERDVQLARGDRSSWEMS